MTAATTRLPRNWNPNVAVLAAASPLQKSLVQYLQSAHGVNSGDDGAAHAAHEATHLTKTRFAVPHSELPSVAKMPPCSIESAQLTEDIQYGFVWKRSLQDAADQQNMLPSK